MARRYTPQQKAHALALYLEHGPAQAGRLTGIPSGTIRQWAKRDGVTVTRGKKAAANVVAATLSWQQRRYRILSVLGDAAEEFIAAGRGAEDAGDRMKHITAAAIVIDKAQLLDGAATARTETRDLTSMVDDAIDEILAARGDDAPTQR